MDMASDLDVSALARAYRRLVLWFGAGLILVFAQLGLHSIPGEEFVRTLQELVEIVGVVAISLALAYYGYRTAQTLGSTVAWVWGLAMLLPLLNLVTLLALSSKATRACRANGVPVGFFGPKLAANGEPARGGVR